MADDAAAATAQREALAPAAAADGDAASGAPAQRRADDLLATASAMLRASAAFEDRLFQALTGSGLLLSAAVQRSEGWFRGREARLTASRFGAIAGVSSFGTRRALWELMTGRVQAPFTGNADTARGTALEPLVLRWYRKFLRGRGEHGLEVRETGLWVDLAKPFIGASPDGLVGERGLVEIKCPRRSPHTAIPADYLAQIQGQLHVTQREWCDFVSFTCQDGVTVFRVARSDAYWKWLYPRLESFFFCIELDEPPEREMHDRNALAKEVEAWCEIRRLL